MPPHPSRGVERGIAAVPKAPPGLLFEKIMATANCNQLIKLIASDLTGWGSGILQTGLGAGSTWLEPPYFSYTRTGMPLRVRRTRDIWGA